MPKASKETASEHAAMEGYEGHVGPGHTPILSAGTEVIEFSPTEQLGRTMEVVMKNVGEMQAGSSS